MLWRHIDLYIFVVEYIFRDIDIYIKKRKGDFLLGGYDMPRAFRHYRLDGGLLTLKFIIYAIIGQLLCMVAFSFEYWVYANWHCMEKKKGVAFVYEKEKLFILFFWCGMASGHWKKKLRDFLSGSFRNWVELCMGKKIGAICWRWFFALEI